MGAKENQPGIIGGAQIVVGTGLLFVPGLQGLGIALIISGSTTLIAGYAFGNDSNLWNWWYCDVYNWVN